MKSLKRYKPFGVGKYIGASVYVHTAYESVLPEIFRHVKKLVPPRLGGRPYDLIKYNTKTGAFTFIWVQDFDTADEPTMGIALIYTPSLGNLGTFKSRTMWPPNDPWIYHHKWLMVKDDYTGFDVALSKARSEIWLGFKNIDKSRIGKKSYWEKHVIPLLKL